MQDLTTTEKYALAEILVCGAIDEKEFQTMNEYSGQLQQDTIRDLHRNGILDYTLYDGKPLNYREQ